MARKMVTMDGNSAAAWVSYAFTEVAGIYPITPSSVMADETDKWSAEGRKNIFGSTVQVVEMQSEAGAAAAVHGSLAAGALTTTYTASQGLLLMIPNMYKIAGELLPGVIHVSARALASHALSIFGDHSDVMACRQTGFAMLAATNAQEVMDLGAVAHLSAIKGRVPFLHFFDGFRTSHEILKVSVWDYDELSEMADHDAIDRFRKNALNPEHPVLRGSAQNPDIFFQAREACNPFYNDLPEVVEGYMDEVNKRIGTDYKLFNYYGDPDAENVIIAMGSVCDTIEETIDYLNSKGEKVGLLKIRLYRPFAIDRFLREMPDSVKRVAVLDRTKEPGAIGEPLYLDVCAAYAGCANAPLIIGGRYGLGSKDTLPAHIISVYDNLKADYPKNGFTISIEDDVTNLSLEATDDTDTTPDGTISCKFYGLGADGTVGANKNSIKIIGDHTDKKVQAYFSYDSKKSGGITVSHLRFGDKPIKSTYLINKANFVACHNQSYLDRYEMIEDLKPNGTFLLNTSWNADEIGKRLPAKAKRHLVENNIKMYVCDATAIAREIGLGNRVNMVLQAAFFKLANIIPLDDAVKYMKEAVVKTYGSKGDKIIKMNHDAIDRGIGDVHEFEIPADWANATDTPVPAKEVPEFIEKILNPISRLQGDKLPVSAFKGREDGTLDPGSTAYEKRGVAVDVPEWIPENCIQCNQCSYVCPHAVIRPVALDEEEAAKAPEGMKMTKMNGKGCENYKYSIVMSALDCYGCVLCANVCPAKQKALVMKPVDTQMEQQKAFEYGITIPEKKIPFATETVKGSQFKKPLLEFSGACLGCGETPYAKLITQLYGERMYIANATGCSSIWGGSAPNTPYTKNFDGHGPAWGNSLFEDNAEYGYGMALAVNKRRQGVAEALKVFADAKPEADTPAYITELISASAEWLAGAKDAEASRKAADRLIPAVEAANKNCGSCGCEWDVLYRFVLDNKDMLVKKSIWAFGGDGWAYDIGFGGLDHVIACGDDINIFVFDTEVYSNTGGQSSKSSQIGSVAQFAATGKNIVKKDLASIAMSYGYVYVAQIAMGADYNQTIKAITEAESYPGPSLIIAYAPCIMHGNKNGMGNSQLNAKHAVNAGYWHNFRFDPRLKAEGKNPFQLDSKEPTLPSREYMMNEVRYSSLFRKFPERAEALMQQHEKQLKARWEHLQKLQELYRP